MISAKRSTAPMPYSILVGSSKLKLVKRFMGKCSFLSFFIDGGYKRPTHGLTIIKGVSVQVSGISSKPKAESSKESKNRGPYSLPAFKPPSL
jgi:hypothetical protein